MRGSRFLLLPFVAILLLANAVQAATLERLSLDEMISKSTDIVRGRVHASYTSQQGPVIYSHFRVDVTERWKGNPAQSMDVAIPGGTAGNLRQTFSGAPKLLEASEYVLFLWTGASGLTHVIGLSQGVFDLKRDSSGAIIALRAASTETVLDAGGNPVRDEAVQMRLMELKTRVASVLSKGTRR